MFSTILRQLRDSKNMTQKDLAEHLNISDRNIRFYESGQRIPPSDTLIKIANYFDVTVDYLLGREPYQAPAKFNTKEPNSITDFDISSLSDESKKDLKKYIELLKIKDMQNRNSNKDEIFVLEQRGLFKTKK